MEGEGKGSGHYSVGIPHLWNFVAYSDDAFEDGIFEETDRRFDADLFFHVLSDLFHRADTEEEVIGHFLVAFFFPDKLEDPFFAFVERNMCAVGIFPDIVLLIPIQGFGEEPVAIDTIFRDGINGRHEFFGFFCF